MYEGSLFEKLSRELSAVKYSDKEALYISVANNLSNIFSTNVGSSPSSPDYGKPELNDINLGLEESLFSISENFKKSILKYEPRLHDVTVKAFADPKNLSKIYITIVGFLNVNHQDHRVIYKAYISGDGHIEVKK